MRDEDEREDTWNYRDGWLLMQSQRERVIRCAYPTDTGVPCGARPETADRADELLALKRHVRLRHLGGLAVREVAYAF